MMRRYVFVCSDMDFIKLQYRDFDTPDKGLVLLTKARRLFKGISIMGLSKYKIVDLFTKIQFEKAFKSIRGDDNCCFIIYSREYESYRTTIVRYLRKKYSNCKIVVYYGDLISRHRFNVDSIKKEVDMVFSFDIQDAEKYRLNWVLEPFSSSILKMKDLSSSNNPTLWDVTFVGNAKNRYDRIIALYEELIAKGLKCDFHITGVPKTERKYIEDIKYDRLDFVSLLRHVVSSKCVAEVMQNDGMSPTTRYTEAMLFGKNLITDCSSLKKSKIKLNNILFYSDVKDLEYIKKEDIIKDNFFDRGQYILMFSIDSMVQSVDFFLNRQTI